MGKRTSTKSAVKAASGKTAAKAPANKGSKPAATKKTAAAKNAGQKGSSRIPVSSSSKRTSVQSVFKEKLNTVTPSGYRDQTFFEQVFNVARQIPKGRVTSYGAIAASLGAKSSSRLVGWAMNLAGSAKPKVPAHRVVNRNGMLSGKHHFATPTQMQELLEKEGIKVKNDKVVEFNRLFWDPMDL
ncbi:MGMT family protein [Pseudoflavitalea rhizosphaerae]|uniref:MGMT family protein n=1 Tax=Pseudoflavitalea rhizosphaerae TaxID=1884793 RepID=UPI000F8E0074|nr:MGMT family protein [Pseudoflavitalea rhizosphaerae]